MEASDLRKAEEVSKCLKEANNEEMFGSSGDIMTQVSIGKTGL